MAAIWRKYYCKVLDNTFLMSDNNAFVVFMKLMAAVNNNGEFVTTTREFAQLVNLNYSSTLRAVERLEANNMITRISTERGKNTIYKIRNWRRYQMAKQKTEQPAEQPTTDMFERAAEQQSKQKTERYASRGGAERPKLQGSKKPLDIDNRNNTYKGFEISDMGLADEIRAFIDYRTKKDKGFTQFALDRNLKKLRSLYPGDVEMQRECISECIAHGWSGIFELKHPKQAAATEGWF